MLLYIPYEPHESPWEVYRAPSQLYLLGFQYVTTRYKSHDIITYITTFKHTCLVS